MKNSRNILLGIIIIIIGIILGANAMGITNINIFFDGWWTLFIIIPCLIGLFKDSNKTGSIIGILIGIMLLLCNQGVCEFDIIWKFIFPIILVMIGLSFIFKGTFNRGTCDEIKMINEKSSGGKEHCTIFSGQDINFAGEEFSGTTLTAVFGGIKCDLTKAIINEDAVINATSVFGGMEIYVPNDVKVKTKQLSVFGGVSDERKTNEETGNAKIIYVNASCVFGGVEIK